jgi:hypothetical protein
MIKLSALYAFLISQSIWFPFIVGLVRYRRIGETYRPFFILMAVSVFTELLTGYLIEITHVHNGISSNIFVLVEWLLISWQFYVWEQRPWKAAYLLLALVPLVIWIGENLVFGQIKHFSPYFRVFAGFAIVMLSVNKINFMITHDNRKLYTDPKFLICIAFIIFFIYRIILEWAYQTSLSGVTETTNIIIMLNAYFNALTNIIFAIALLCIPRPQKFTLK